MICLCRKSRLRAIAHREKFFELFISLFRKAFFFIIDVL